MTRAPAPIDDDAPAWLAAPAPEGGGLTGLRLARALKRLADLGAASGDRDVAELAGMVAGWVHDRARVRLDTWLGISEPGRGGVAEALRIADRDVLLRAVADLPRYAGLSRQAAAHMIAQRWRRWHAVHAERLPSAAPADPEAALFWHLCHAGHQPISAETIRKVLAREV